MPTILAVLNTMFRVLGQNQTQGHIWHANPWMHEFTELRDPTGKPVRIVSSPGTATCGWCHERHSIEQIKVCRWEANHIRPEVFEAARLKALNTASKLKEKNK
jgi:hypothetical protein